MADKPDIADIEWGLNNVADPITGVNNKIEPSGIKKTNGWDRLEKPPREYPNWLWFEYYKWHTFINDFFELFRGQTTNATATEIFLNGVASSRLGINANEIITFEATINAILDDASQSISWKIKNDIIRPSGSPYILIQNKEILNANNWDITTAVYLQEFDVSPKEIVPTGVFFRQDGLKMYTIGSDGQSVDEYDLDPAWDVSSAVYLQEFDVSPKEVSPGDLFFKPDGLKMYTIGSNGDSVDEYDLGTAWNVTTAVYLQEFDVSPKEIVPTGLFFRQDGLKMYTIGSDGESVDEYDLGTAWNVTTAVYLQEFDVSPKEADPTGVFFRQDGLKMYTIGLDGDSVDEYDLDPAWDVTSAVYLQEFDVNPREATPQGLFFRQDGSKMYTIGNTGDSVDEYDLPLAWDVNFEADITNNALVPKVTGEGSKTIEWVIKLEKLVNKL